MANPIKGEAELGGKTLAFRFGTFCDLEERTGKKVPELLQAMAEGLGFNELKDFVCAGLMAHHSDMTEADVEALLNDVGYNEAGLAVGKAVGGFFGEQKEKGTHPRKGA